MKTLKRRLTGICTLLVIGGTSVADDITPVILSPTVTTVEDVAGHSSDNVERVKLTYWASPTSHEDVRAIFLGRFPYPQPIDITTVVLFGGVGNLTSQMKVSPQKYVLPVMPLHVVSDRITNSGSSNPSPPYHDRIQLHAKKVDDAGGNPYLTELWLHIDDLGTNSSERIEITMLVYGNYAAFDDATNPYTPESNDGAVQLDPKVKIGVSEDFDLVEISNDLVLTERSLHVAKGDVTVDQGSLKVTSGVASSIPKIVRQGSIPNYTESP